MTVIELSRAKRGRPPTSSRAEIEREAMALFLRDGYGQTTLDDIAAAAGVSRTTLLRYCGSKSDLVWAEFDQHIAIFREQLSSADESKPPVATAVAVIVKTFAHSVASSPSWSDRFAVMDTDRELRGEEAARWTDWAGVLSEFLATRSLHSTDDLIPNAVSGALQTAFVTILRRWTAGADSAGEPVDLLANRLASLVEPLDGLLSVR